MNRFLVLMNVGALCGAIAVSAAGCGDDDDAAAAGTAGTTAGAAGTSAGTAGTSAGTAGTGGGGDCSQDMYTKYKEAGFLAVNDKIIAKAAAAPTDKVGGSFAALTPDGVAHLKMELGVFLIQAYGGPKNYTGKTMEQAHAGLAITSDQYDYFISDVVVPALTEAGVTADDIGSCFAPVVTNADFKASVINK